MEYRNAPRVLRKQTCGAVTQRPAATARRRVEPSVTKLAPWPTGRDRLLNELGVTPLIRGVFKT